MDNRHTGAGRRATIENMYPLSAMQEGLLFHGIATPQDGVYVPQIILRIRGSVDTRIMRDSWAAVIARHGVLRTTFHWEERDEPFQVVHAAAPLTWSEFDWSDLDAGEQESRLATLLSDNRQRPFDLKRAPLMRLQWIDCGGTDARLVLQYHHIVLDGWSAARVVDDAFKTYQILTGSSRAPLPPPLPYVNYIAWLKNRERDATRHFWMAYTSRIKSACRIASQDEGAMSGFSRQNLTCNPDMSAKAVKFCRTVGITPNTLLQSALAIVIARKTGRRNVVFGATTAGRPADLTGVENMVGLFINTLPVCIDVETGPLLPWLQKLQQQQSACAEHDHLPLRDIQAGRGDLFDCLLVFENYPVPRDVAPGATFTLTGVDVDEWTHYPLTLFAAADSTRISIAARYERKSFQDTNITAFLEEMEKVIGEIADGHQAIPEVCETDAAPAMVDAAARVETTDIRPVAAANAHLKTETEETIASIWTEILKVPVDGSRDNFFHLGGHSLLAARVVNRVRREYAINLPVKMLFDRPVLAEFAAVIDALKVTAAPMGVEHSIEI